MPAFNEDQHPRVAAGPKGGQFARKPGWSARPQRGRGLTWEQLDKHLETWFGPDPLEARRVKHPRSGYMVEAGEGRRVTRPPDSTHGNESLGIEGPPTFDVTDHGDPNSPEYNSLKYMNPQPNRTEPIQFVYRGVSEAEWEQIQKRGYLASDQRGTISSLEGTNAAVDPRSAVSYLPPAGHSRVLKIAVKPDDQWFTIRADDYLRTRQRVPLDRVKVVSPLLSREGKHGQLSIVGSTQATVRRSVPLRMLGVRLEWQRRG